jgi:hypothetical protein
MIFINRYLLMRSNKLLKSNFPIVRINYELRNYTNEIVIIIIMKLYMIPRVGLMTKL